MSPNILTTKLLPKTQLFLLQLLIAWLFQSTNAFVPPKPGSDLEQNYEPLHVYRSRLGITTYNYTPTLLHPEACRFITEEECQQADLNLQQHAKKHQQIQKQLYQERRRARRIRQLQQQPAATDENQQQQQQQEFQEALGAFSRTYAVGGTPPSRDEEVKELEQLLAYYNTTFESEKDEHRRHLEDQGEPNGLSNPSVGTFRVLILLLRFTDHADRKLPDKYEYQILWNLRITKWLEENSYGQYKAYFDVQDWMMTDNTEEHYSFGEYGRVVRFQNAFYPLLNELEQQPGWSWAPYDVDNDGYLDNLIVLHSGYDAAEGGNDCTNGRSAENRVWSHAFSDAGEWKSADGQYSVLGYMIASALDLTCNSNPAKMGVMTHEYLHTFYLIDLYDLSYTGKGVGNFDIMGYPYGHTHDGYIPVHLSSWSKQQLDWLTCTEITSAGEYTLRPVAETTDCYRITLLDITDFDEYLLIENRQQEGFDINHFSNGIAMYHIDDWAIDQSFPGMPGQEGWPDNGNHYRVAVVQADGNYDLEHGTNIGDGGDVWKEGMMLTPNDDGATFPNTDSYQEGYIENTGVIIEILEQSGRDMKFRVSYSDRSGNTLFSAPVKEGQDRPVFTSTQRPTDVHPEPLLEHENDRSGADAAISGKLPIMPWYDEWREQQQGIAEEDSANYGFVAARPSETTSQEPGKSVLNDVDTTIGEEVVPSFDSEEDVLSMRSEAYGPRLGSAVSLATVLLGWFLVC